MHDQALEHALQEFGLTLDEIKKRATDAAVSALDNGNEIVAMQLAETASDVVACGRMFLDAQRAAVPVSRAEAERVLSLTRGMEAEWTVASQPLELEELRVILKAWFFFTRALCDNIYRLLLAQAEGRPAPKGGSMNSALDKPQNPVAEFLAAQEPGFLYWFRSFRDKRNEIKEGVNFGLTELPGLGLGVTFNTFTPNRGLVIDLSSRRTVSVGDVVEAAFRVSGALAHLRKPGADASVPRAGARPSP
jgi:hypothetical protein